MHRIPARTAATGTGRGWNRPVVVLLASQTVAAFGTTLGQFAITWYLTLETESGVTMALSIVFGLLPQAVISALGGVLADRTDRRLLITASQAMIAAATVGLALALLGGYREHWLIFLVLTMRSVGAGLRTPAVLAAIPQLVPPRHLLRTNGAFQTAQSAISILSPVAAATALGASSLTLVLLIDVAMTLLALVLLLATRLPRPTPPAGDPRWSQDLLAGLRYARQHAFARWVFTVGVVVILLGAAPAYLVPLRIARSFGDQIWLLGGSQIAVSLGMITIGVVAAVLGRRLNLTALLAAAPFAFGAACLVLGLTQDIWILFAAMFLAGAALTAATGLSVTLLQERVDGAYLGRVLGLYGLVMFCMPLGLVAFGPLADVVALETIFVGTGVALLLAGALVAGRPAGRAALATPLVHPEPASTSAQPPIE